MEKEKIKQLNKPQVFYSSKETSNCPYIPNIIQTVSEIKKHELFENLSEIIISHRYAKRIVINTESKTLNRDDFIEVVDYDPLKNIFLIMGSKHPRDETSIHWMIHHAREEINTVIQINSKKILEKKYKNTSKIEEDYINASLDQIKEILRNLRDSKIVDIKNHGLLFVGNNLNEINKSIFNLKLGRE